MPLPTVALPTSSVEVNGSMVPFRSLSRAEGLQLHTYQDKPDEAEIQILMWGTSCTREEAITFREGSTVDAGGKLVDAILVLSGLTTEAEAPDPKPRTNGASSRAQATPTLSS